MVRAADSRAGPGGCSFCLMELCFVAFVGRLCSVEGDRVHRRSDFCMADLLVHVPHRCATCTASLRQFCRICVHSNLMQSVFMRTIG